MARFSARDAYRTYGIAHFLQKYGMLRNEQSKVKITYGDEMQRDEEGFSIQIVENDIQDNIHGYLMRNESNGGEKAPLFERPVRLHGKVLAVFADENGEYPCVVLNGRTITFGFDVFNEVGHILSGHLERFWAAEEEEYRNLAKIPIVDYYEKMLFESLSQASRALKMRYKYFWPDGKKFAVCLTHDVDRVHKSYQYITHILKHLKKRDFIAAFNQIASIVRKLCGDEPYWNFERIMEIERSSGVRSTFFFLNEQQKRCTFSPKEWKLYWGRYDIRDVKIVETIRKLDAEGWEIGVHGSYNSYRDFELLRREKKELEEILGKSVCGISQHYCNLDIPKTWEYHEKLGLLYDASLGFVTDIGFRWGTCHPFHPFDPASGRILSLWELPITIMDNACAYHGWKDIMEVINTVERYNGLLLLRWHQCVFNEREFPGRSEIYRKIINICRKKGAWITNARDVVNFLMEREHKQDM